MTLTLPWQGTTSRAKHAGQTPTQLKNTIAQLLADNRTLIGETSDLNCAVHKALMNSLRDEMRIAQAERERDAAVAEVRRLQGKVIRAGAEHERLRQAVIAARPRITAVPSEMVRPYSPEVVLPYVSPVPYRDTSNETTQTLPLIDVPQRAA
ncbi:hypothetical protein ACFYM2_21380 [Streptomyces sp. NPDC006711]|uniref:hypothetical protein n=1 Tax=Streptomyces sp. NPDC006711 TaxID=3364762 RepID=UPI00368E05B0